MKMQKEDVLPKGTAGYERGQRLRKAVIETKNYVCVERAILATQAYKENEDKNIFVKRALTLDKILRNMRVYILEDELIVGHQAEKQRSAPIFPEFAVDWIVDEIDMFETRPADKFIFPEEDREKFLTQVVPYFKNRTLSDRAYAEAPEEVKKLSWQAVQFSIGIHEQGGFGHVLQDYGKFINVGMKAMRDKAQEKLDNLDLTKANDIKVRAFYQSIVIICDAVVAYANRYADEAERCAAIEKDEKRKQEFLEIARVCRRVPEYPAEDFHEALQSFWFAQLIPQIYDNGVSISPGRFDQYLYPFYEKDVESGKRTKAECQELLEATWVKFVEPMKIYSAEDAQYNAGFPMGQNLCIGGVDREGNDATNDLSYRILEAHRKMLLMQPNFSARVHKDTPHDFLIALCEAIRYGNGMPQLVCDEIYMEGLMKLGVSLEDARDYALEGCVEGTPLNAWGRGNGGYFSHIKVLELTLNNGKDTLTGVQAGIETGDPATWETFEDFQAAYKKQVEYCASQLVKWNNILDHIHKELMPVPFTSLLIDDCLEKGLDVTEGGAKYNWTGPPSVGIANIGNSIYAIKKVVFEDKKYTMAELVEALRTNWEGKEPMRQYFLNKVTKYGNDEPKVDKTVRWAIDTYLNAIGKHETYRGGPFIGGLVPVSSYVGFGQKTAATPDGRKSGEPLADGISPALGTDVKGMTAVIKSVTKLDHSRCPNGVILNLKLNPLTANSPEGLEKMAACIRTYFELGGEHVQFNVVTAEKLRKAQQNPEKYKNLVVRVAGYSAFFNELAPEIQESIIQRTENNL